ncbi:MAG: hypothetical protein IPH36_20220 [Saprospiraceae bacterium]|nr:hypothetical protein [Saprospiraceae bacterium]
MKRREMEEALQYHKLYLELKILCIRLDYANKMSAMSGYYELNEKKGSHS